MAEQTITPPPHLLKQFSEQAKVESNKRGGSGYVKTLARLCIEWAMEQLNTKPTSNSSQIKSSDITPPPELVQQWCDASKTGEIHFCVDDLATRAAQWGADQELEACCDWVGERLTAFAANLKAARRPKLPSLKEQALMALEDGDIGPGASLTPVEVCIIRRALEALPE